MKTLTTYLLVLISLLFAANSLAVDPTYTGFFSNEAIKGYDTVAYFTEGKPAKGSAEFSTEYNQAIWLFASQENLDLFLQNPTKYAPQYGGYCAYAVANNTTASIKPELFTIHDGKLYLNYNESVNEKWRADKDTFIEQANKHWPTLLAE